MPHLTKSYCLSSAEPEVTTRPGQDLKFLLFVPAKGRAFGLAIFALAAAV